MFKAKLLSYLVLFFCFLSFGVNAVSQDGKKPLIKVGVLKWGTAYWELKTFQILS